MRKKILILSSKIGNGHLSPAQAVQQALNKLYPDDYKVEIIDVVTLLNKHLNNLTRTALYNTIQHAPYLYKILYSQFDRKTQMKMLNLIQYPLIYKKIQNFLHKQNPDLIVSTYPIWDYNIVKISKKNQTPPPFVSVVTDSINIHSAWLTADVDYHIVANQDTKKELTKAGIAAKKIYISGLPIRLQFQQKIHKTSICKKYKLLERKKTILFVVTAENPSKAVKQLKEIVKACPDDNCVVICGNNDKACEKLKKQKWASNVKIFKFVKNLHELLAVADVVVSKAGGSIVQECIALKKPIILSQVIPGHEEGNASLIRKYKLGIDTTAENLTLKQAIHKIFQSYPQYIKRLQKQAKPKAALDVAKFLHKLITSRDS